MDNVFDIVSRINEYLSDYILVILLFSTGVFFTVRTGFVQVRCFAEGWKNAFGRLSFRTRNEPGTVSPFQALSTAVAAQVGTGNIVGASGAILAGGPGAIFWMWIIAFFSMATIYAEAVLAQKTRITDPDGTLHGGPVYYIKTAFPNVIGKVLAGLFAVAVIAALGFMGGMVQANSIGETCSTAFGIPAWVIGGIIAICSGLVFLGGVSRLAKVTEKLVPVMALLYITGGFLVLLFRIEYLPETFALIFKYAFAPDALLGGTFGHALKTAISLGVKRGLFSNEAGMGSTPHAHAAASVPTPHVQGTIAMIGVFVDTAIVLTMTALIIISTIYTGDGVLANAAGGNYQQMVADAQLTQTNLVQHAIASVTTPDFGNVFIAVCLIFFAYSTILSWNYFGKINVVWLFGKKAAFVYLPLTVICIFLGTTLKSDLVWALQDMLNQLMVLPNVLALFALSGIAIASAKAKK